MNLLNQPDMSDFLAKIRLRGAFLAKNKISDPFGPDGSSADANGGGQNPISDSQVLIVAYSYEVKIVLNISPTLK